MIHFFKITLNCCCYQLFSFPNFFRVKFLGLSIILTTILTHLMRFQLERFITLGIVTLFSSAFDLIYSNLVRYFVDPGVKSGNLLKFLRSKETRHYKEASRIPTQQYPKMQVFKEVLGEGIKPKPTPAHKKARMIMFDSSERFHLYDRPILIRDHDNTWRTCTWEERRFVENSRRYLHFLHFFMIVCSLLLIS